MVIVQSQRKNFIFLRLEINAVERYPDILKGKRDHISHLFVAHPHNMFKISGYGLRVGRAGSKPWTSTSMYTTNFWIVVPPLLLLGLNNYGV